VLFAANQVFAAEIVLSAANPCFLPKLCCLQRTDVRYQKCVVCSESVFVAEIVLFAANQHLLPKFYVVCSESVFVAKIMLVAANQQSLLKLCCLH
jgi:hypothetical protein